ncbi:DNA-binding transcriptional regulator, LysR family [Cupriavidus sp. OV038]|jgi:DNA-binding transcriptional LysR family regulator|uniref:LysR substrate-binding domain-containing protein n=1 Tax=unclassified Cupriavidus TaxID=2640874 RepID=UPI0008E857B6|nr:MULTISPECIES: LysR substrate-binding domain-containing protein [unclassified Cupriavidus]SFC61052.1 DNA-binding transcriptional regulator, LysR family [Cupriavidus sp. OV038]SFP41952.1 DNA-binding transcriptional regulator, LysR family [Cupriavidus sp. OV096]
MLDLKDVYFFVQVVDRGGFTSAGEVLRLPKSTLSHRVKELEASLGVRLINRTSRQFAMTEVGQEFYQYAMNLLRSAEVAEEAMRQRLAEPSGVIRVTTAAEIAQFALRHVLPTFLSENPKVKIVETATDRLVDIVGEGFDLAIRGHTGQLQDSNLIQHPLAKAPWYLFAGPEYLERMSVPAEPEDLMTHSLIGMVSKGPLQWHLQGPDKRTVTVPIDPRFQSNSLISLKEAACANIGIAALPGYICQTELKAGALRQILPQWIAADARITALIPYRIGLLPAVRTMVDYLAEVLPKVTAFDRG